jgi:hypothetical protein
MEKIHSLSERDKIKTFLLLWRWWHERNRANVGEAIKSSNDICSLIDFFF